MNSGTGDSARLVRAGWPAIRLDRILGFSAMPSIVILLALIALNVVLQPKMFGNSALGGTLQTAAPVILICMAQAVVVLSGELDLSVGAGLSVVNCVLAYVPTAFGVGLGSAMVVALLAALIAGMINGVLVAYLRLNSLIVTFATGAIWFGMALALIPQPGGEIPEALGDLFSLQWGPLPFAMMPVVLACGLWSVLQRTRFGRRLIATGSNREAVFKSGIDVRRVKLGGYLLAWFFVFLSTVCMSAQTMSGDARLGLPYMLSSVAAVVIGGISLAGGRGSMTGAVCGACILVLLGNIIYFAGIPSNYQEMFKGGVIMFALAFTFMSGKRA